MKKILLYIAPLLLLGACTNQTTHQSTAPVNPITPSQSSSSVEASSLVKDKPAESSSTTPADDYKYAVNLKEFEKDLFYNDEFVKKIYSHGFTTSVAGVPTVIGINLKDLNPFGMGIYIQYNDDERHHFYPISIQNIPTKEITVAKSVDETRTVKVNTAITIQENHDKQDPLQIAGETFYLFYNKNGTISLATKYFGTNSTTMIEYEWTRDSEQPSEEVANNPYYDIILSAKQQQQAYIDSLEDEEIKSSVQTAYSAAVATANSLVMDHPNDEELINTALEKVLAGE